MCADAMIGHLLQHSCSQHSLFILPSGGFQAMSLEREIACDDYVLHQVRILTLMPCCWRSRRSNATLSPLLAPGASNNKTQLQQRIDMILNTRRNTCLVRRHVAHMHGIGAALFRRHRHLSGTKDRAGASDAAPQPQILKIPASTIHVLQRLHQARKFLAGGRRSRFH